MRNDNAHKIAHELEEKPLDPAVERVRRKLMRLMLISVGITMVLILAVLAAVIYKVVTPNTDISKNIAQNSQGNSQFLDNALGMQTQQEMLIRSLKLPNGAKILEQSLSDTRILLRIETRENNIQLLLYDFVKNQYLATIAVE